MELEFLLESPAVFFDMKISDLFLTDVAHEEQCSRLSPMNIAVVRRNCLEDLERPKKLLSCGSWITAYVLFTCLFIP